ncbi:structural protein [Vibrio astriarenae]|uniref:Structural protein n=2 Tax=Vibrio astriarenae TaxID=1481923 RepID=A0A7Z2T5U0_9VIBR|nr:structural protein [Vibrio astriarenae]
MILAFVILCLIGVWGARNSDMTKNLLQPRGVRNNNPLNIRIGNNDWQGKASTSNDDEFETFTHSKYGFRAGAKILQNYQTQYGLYTLAEMINRFAPPNENNTKNYAAFVAGEIGVDVNQRVDMQDRHLLARTVHAMSIMEVGRHYTINDAIEGVALV